MNTPDPPSPQEQASAQGVANRSAAQTSAVVNNYNESTPFGGVEYSVDGYETITDENGRPVEVPRYRRTTTVSPTLATANRNNERTQLELSRVGKDQSRRIGAVLGSQLDTSGMTPYSEVGQTGAEDRRRVEDALLARLRGEYNRDREGLNAQLAAQGVRPGSEAYSRDVNELNDAREEARFQALMFGGQEQDRIRGAEMAQAGFNNNVRASQLAEALTLRSLPINETTALMSGSQVAAPQFVGPAQQAIAPVDIAGMMRSNYAQQSNNANSFNAGLFGLAGAGARGAATPGLFF